MASTRGQKNSIRHVERHVVTFRVRRNFAIRQRSNSSRRLPSLTSRVSSHVAYVLTRYMSFRRIACSAKSCVFSTRRAYSSCSSSTRRAYLFDTSCAPLRRVVHTSSTRRAYLFDASCISRPLRRDV